GVSAALLASGTIQPRARGHAVPHAGLVVTVDTTSNVVDGSVGSVAALLADPGHDGNISFLEALIAVNNSGPGNTIAFGGSLGHGATIVLPYTVYLLAPDTVIDGSLGGGSNPHPDILIQNGGGAFISLEIDSDGNTVQNLAITGLVLRGANSFGNLISNVYAGTDVDGTVALPLHGNGIEIDDGAHDNTVFESILAGNVNPTAVADGFGY